MRSSREGTMPAGMVLVVVVAALVVAMFFSADAISRKAAGRRNNAEWRRTTADAVAKVSGALKLDVPAQAIDDALGPHIGHERKTSSDKTSADIAAEARAANGAGPASGPTGSVPVVPVDLTPKLRAPTPAEPLKLWVGGDSISYEPGVALTNIIAKSKLFSVTQESKASTGLTRPDYFNWPEHLLRDIVPTDPDVMVMMFGGNDAQNIPAFRGKPAYLLGSSEWQAEYRQRVGDTMDILKSKSDDRLVVWLGAPIMGPGTVKNVDQMNYIYATEAKKRPWVKYVDSWVYFTDASGNFARTLPSADGTPRAVRGNDNIHMSVVGGNRLAWVVYQRLGQLIDLNAVPITPDPESAPPRGLVERAAVPPGEGSTVVP